MATPTLSPVPHKVQIANDAGFVSEPWAKWFRALYNTTIGTVTSKVLINSQYAASAGATLYTAPAGTRTTIDKFTATNTDVSTQTLTVYIVPSGGTVGGSNTIIVSQSIAAGVTFDSTALQNQLLNTGDFINVKSSVDSKIVIRASGREAT